VNGEGTRGAEAHLAAFLAERDAPCPGCGYNLRGLTTGRCPECDRELTLEIRLVEPRLGPWVAAVVGASVMAGFHTLLACYFLWMSVVRTFGPRISEVWPLFIFSPLGFGLLAVLVRRRRAYTGLSWAGGALIAAGVVLAAVVSAVVFFVAVR